MEEGEDEEKKGRKKGMSLGISQKISIENGGESRRIRGKRRNTKTWQEEQRRVEGKEKEWEMEEKEEASPEASWGVCVFVG